MRSSARKPGAPRLGRARWRRLVATLLLLVVGLEGVTRLGLRVLGRPYDAAARRTTIERLTTPLAGVEAATAAEPGGEGADAQRVPNVPHPYFGWEPQDIAQRIGRDVAHFAEPHSPRCVDLLVVGSSVAAALGNKAGDELVAAYRARAGLDEGTPIRLLRYGRGSFKQPQQEMLFHYLLDLGMRPDAVVCLDGLNKLVSALFNHRDGIHPSYPMLSTWGGVVGAAATDPDVLRARLDLVEAAEDGLRWARRAREDAWMTSAVLGELCTLRAATCRQRWDAARRRLQKVESRSHRAEALAGPPFEGSLEDALRTEVLVWERSLTQMQAVCTARGIPLLHVLQPNPNLAGSKPLTTAEAQRAASAEEWAQAVAIGYPLLFERYAHLGAGGLHTCDATRLFADEPAEIWVDAGHMNAAGDRRLATYVGERLADVVLQGRATPRRDAGGEQAPGSAHADTTR